MKDDIPKPFLKWAGGKGQILDIIDRNLPIKFERYFEPFLGGGAVFFHLWRYGFRGQAFLSDINKELIEAYMVVRDAVEDLIEELQNEIYKANKETFYKIRQWDRDIDWSSSDKVKRTARLIYLNRTCYNGLYRVNSKGHFNVPYGGYKNPTICQEDNLRAASISLQDVQLRTLDFVDAVKDAKNNDLVYFDPPYQPLSQTSSFTSYTTGGFGETEQKALAELFSTLHKRGCFVLESNSSHNFITSLYSNTDFIIESIKAKRAISCVPEGRGEIDELLIRNYNNTQQQRLLN